MAHRRPDKIDGKNYRGKSRFKGKLKCILCHKEGQFKRDCSEKKKHKENERSRLERERIEAKAKREKARKEWEERPQIIYTPMGNKR